MIRVLVTLCALAGCAGDAHDITLDVTGTCQPAEPVAVISVELWGKHDGEPCAIARRCLYDPDVDTAADVAAALRAVNQPLIDVTDPDAHTIAVLGHAASCFDHTDHVVCGFADLADTAGDGTLAIPLACTCPTQDIPFCP